MREVHPTRRGKTLWRWHRAEFRVAAARHERADTVARTPGGHRRADGFDRAGELEPWNVGDAGRRWIASLPLEDVGPIHAGGRSPDEHLAGTDGRHRAFDRHEHV